MCLLLIPVHTKEATHNHRHRPVPATTLAMALITATLVVAKAMKMMVATGKYHLISYLTLCRSLLTIILYLTANLPDGNTD